MTKPRPLGNKAVDVIEAVYRHIDKQEHDLFDSISAIARGEPIESVNIQARIRDDQQRVKRALTKLMSNQMDEALRILAKQDTDEV